MSYITIPTDLNNNESFGGVQNIENVIAAIETALENLEAGDTATFVKEASLGTGLAWNAGMLDVSVEAGGSTDGLLKEASLGNDFSWDASGNLQIDTVSSLDYFYTKGQVDASFVSILSGSKTSGQYWSSIDNSDGKFTIESGLDDGMGTQNLVKIFAQNSGGWPGIIIADEVANQLEFYCQTAPAYSVDMSSSYTDRSLVDKAYVDGKLSSGISAEVVLDGSTFTFTNGLLISIV